MKASVLIKALQSVIDKMGHDVEVALTDREGETNPQEIYPMYDPQTGDIGLDGSVFNEVEDWAGHKGEWEFDGSEYLDIAERFKHIKIDE